MSQRVIVERESTISPKRRKVMFIAANALCDALRLQLVNVLRQIANERKCIRCVLLSTRGDQNCARVGPKAIDGTLLRHRNYEYHNVTASLRPRWSDPSNFIPRKFIFYPANSRKLDSRGWDEREE